MMHFVRVVGFGALMAGMLALAVPTEVVAQKKKPADKNAYPAASDADYKVIQNQKTLTGKFVSSDTGNLTLRVETSRQEANPKYKPNANNPQATQQAQLMRQYQDLQLQMQRAATARTPREAAQAQQRIAQDMARIQQQMAQQNAKYGAKAADPNNQPFITVTTTKDFELEIKEGATVRKMFLPFEYDDTGNIKTYTDKEKKELKGPDTSKPGYMAKMDELQPNMEVKLTLQPPPKKKKEDAPKEKDKDAAPEDKTVARPTITMILATKDVPGSGIQGAGADAPKKKKNQ